MRPSLPARLTASFLIVAPLPVAADAAGPARHDVDIPPGLLGGSLDLLARRIGVNLVLAEPALWSRSVPALRGRYTAEAAVRRIARSAGLVAIRLGATGWRLLRPPRRDRFVPPRAARDVAESEIVVLASKRDSQLGALPITVERFTDLSIGSGAGSEALIRASSAITSTYRGAGREKLFVRGFADSSYAGQTQSVTGVYFGDLRVLYSATDPDLQLHDVQSVEVLHGPQGTLYGSGSLGGIIRINPRLPERDRNVGTAEVGATAMRGGAAGADVNAMLNLPLAGAAALRIVAYARQDGGFIDKPDLGRNVNRTRTSGGRSTIRWWVAPDWTADVVAMGQQVNARDSLYADIPPYQNTGSLAEPYSSRFGAGHVVVEGGIRDARLTTSTGLVRQRLDERFDSRESTVAQGVVDVSRRDRMLQHESRLSYRGADGVGWVVGFSHVRHRSIVERAFLQLGATTDVENRITETAVYGEVTMRVTPALLIGGGGRIGRAAQVGRGIVLDDHVVSRRRQSWLLPTGSILVDLSPRVALYGRYQKGIRPGSLVVGSGGVAARVDRDRLSAVELGVRLYGNAALTGTAALSLARWQDIQADFIEAGGSGFIANLGDGRIASAHLTAMWDVSSHWTASAALTLNHSRLSMSEAFVAASSPDGALAADMLPGLADASTAARSLRSIPNIAGAIGRLSLRHRSGIGTHWRLNVEGWGRLEGVARAAIGKQLVGRQGGYVLAGINAALSNGRHTFSLDVDNLLNDDSARFVLGSSVPSSIRRPTPLRPLTARLGLKWQY